ncbi:MAG: bifunctional metallophosphatase/5'-nucleotidase [Ignavibacteriae bacterium]|nr:bifunctional metallophosphatase/5'-nucleotidase [Ignavibacteriota bacterium]
MIFLNTNKLRFVVLFFTAIISNYAQNVNVKIVETSDIHGAIYPFNFTENKKSNNSMAQIFSYIKSERENKNQQLILLDNGDILQGDPSVYYYNFVKTDTTHLLANVMNYMKYDAGTVGNHDIEAGHSVYDNFKSELNFPWLAANAINTETNEPYFPPYKILNFKSEENKEIKIAILGLITPGIPNWLPKNIWSGIEFEDMIITAKKWIPIIKGKENPDLVIGLFHAGVDFTYDNQTAETPRNENASQLIVEQVPGFDIVFVGHDHHEWNFKVKNSAGDSVLILGPSARSNSFCEANILLSFDKQSKKWKKNISGKILNSSDFEADKNFMNNFSNEFKIVKDFVSREIGTFTKTVSAKNSVFGNSVFVDLIHKIQLELTNADISFTAPLSIYSQIDSGKVYVKDMFDLYRYENLLYTMELTGKEIKDYLEYSYGIWFNTMKDKNDNLLMFEKDENGKLIFSKRNNSAELKNRYYNFDSAEGIEYVVDVSKIPGDRITIKSFSNENNFDLTKKYKVAINSYRGNGGGGHLVNGAKIPKDELSDRVINSTEKDLRFYMMTWIENQKIINPVENKNWKIIPEDWAQLAKKKDYNLLYGTK